MPPFPKVPGVTHTFIKVNNTKLHIAEAGKGKPLLLLHGWPQHWYVWRKVISELSKTYLLIMPDLPGFGWSEMPKEKDFRKEILARDMIQLLNTLKLTQVGLIGHDWGGWIGFLMCLNKPQRFSAYLALGIAHPFQQIDERILYFWKLSYQILLAFPGVGETLLQTTPIFTKSLIKKGTKHDELWSDEELNNFSSILQEQQKAYASSLLYRTFITKEFPHILKGTYRTSMLSVPTQLLVGKDDPVIYPQLIKGFEKYAQSMKVTFIENCGHFIPEEKPEIVIKAAKEIFK